MTPIIKTDRLILRPLRESDAPALVQHLSDWSVMRWLSAPPWPYTLSDAEDFTTRDHKAHWAIDDGNGLIGSIGCGNANLGYWLAKPEHSKGYMTEVVAAVLKDHFAANNTPVRSGHMPGNDASRAVLLKHGFVDTHVEPLLSRSLARETDIQRMELTYDRWHSLRTSAQ
jgi:RimJ/RimL family protein N-acetyltransferase